MKKRHWVGFDLGGTKIEAIALSPEGSVVDRIRIATPQDDYDETVHAIVDLVASMESKAGAAGTVGVGIPGIVSPATGLVKNANSAWLIGRPLDRDLETALARPVRIANDANCFALSEAVDGAGRGAEVALGYLLRRLDVIGEAEAAALSDLLEPPVANRAGRVVGRLRVANDDAAG